MFLTKGAGCHREKLQSLELALRNAGIAHVNIVRVSSIFPPHCKILPRERGLGHLKPGEIVYAVVSDCATNEPNRLLVSSIGVAIPAEKDRYGYLSEHHAFGQTERKASDYAEDLAASMLASTLGIRFDPDEAWDQRKQVFRMAGKIVKTRSITQSAKSDKRGYWTTVVAAGVFLSDESGM